jgi:type I restriction enzyme S subunit
VNDWTEVTLGDVCECVTVGHVGKMRDEYVDDGVPFLRSQNVRPFAIDTTGVLRIGPEFHRKLSKSALKAGDVVVVRTGYPGTAAVIPDLLDGSNCADLVVITPSEKLNGHLLAAIVNSAWGRSTVSSQLVGAAQQHFNVGSAKSLRVRLPNRIVQDRIAAILCAIADLIENNQRRVQVLEEIARAIYREWFVYFRFPGHEDATCVDSRLGSIPEGWDVSTASEVLSVNPRIKVDGVKERPFITMADLRERGMVCLPSATKAINSGAKFQNGDTLLARITPCLENGKTGLVQGLQQGQIGRGSTEFIVLRGRLVGPVFTYCLARSDRFRTHAIQSMSGASGRQRVRNECFDAYQLPVPPSGLAAHFEDVTSPLVKSVHALSIEASCLASLRDVLLPKLVTGQIDVSSLNLDAMVEVSVA